jgi:hypothetical protein
LVELFFVDLLTAFVAMLFHGGQGSQNRVSGG